MVNNLITQTQPSFQLLWTNSSPTSSFSAQTISLDLSNYDAVLIVSLATTNLNRMTSMICQKNSSWYQMLVTVIPSETNSRCRYVVVNDTGVQFSTGYNGTSTSTSSAIPYQIYGIKGFPY